MDSKKMKDDKDRTQDPALKKDTQKEEKHRDDRQQDLENPTIEDENAMSQTHKTRNQGL